MTDDIKLALKKGKIKGAIKLLEEYYSNQHYQEWLDSMRAEYDSLDYYEDVVIQEAEYDADGNIIKEEITESKLIEGKPTFDEWLNETKVINKERATTLEEKEAFSQDTIGHQEYELLREYKAPDNFDDKVNEYLIPYRLKRLEKIFSQKTTGLKKLAIDKKWMSDEKAINDQYRVYEEMYKNAKNGFYDEETNKAIITANETTKKALAPITLLLNTIRGVIEKKILAKDKKIDRLLKAAEDISLSKEDITQEKIDEIKKVFINE